MAISDFTATYFEGSIEGSSDTDQAHSRSIVLLGGCSAENGNSYFDDGTYYYPGFYCTDYTDKATVFYPETQLFGFIASMPEARTRHTAAAVDGKLYAIGGRDAAGTNIGNVIVSE